MLSARVISLMQHAQALGSGGSPVYRVLERHQEAFMSLSGLMCPFRAPMAYSSCLLSCHRQASMAVPEDVPNAM